MCSTDGPSWGSQMFLTNITLCDWEPGVRVLVRVFKNAMVWNSLTLYDKLHRVQGCGPDPG